MDAIARRRRWPLIAATAALLVLTLPSPSSAICVADDAVAQSKGTCATGAATPEPSTPANSALATPIGALGGGGAGGYPGLRIASLVARADTIVRGTVESVAEVGDGVLTVARGADGYVSPVELGEGVEGQGGLSPNSYPVTVCRVGFKVTASVKGPVLPPGATITVESYRPHLGPAWGLLEAGQHGLLLLDGNGALADLYYPVLPVAPGAPVLSGELDALDAVGEYFLLSLRPETPPRVLGACLEGVLNLGSAGDAVESLRLLAASSDPALEGVGLWGLVELKDRQAVPPAVAFLLAHDLVPELPYIWPKIETALDKLDDPALAGAVLPLLSSPNPVLRRTALDALRNMRTPAALPTLVSGLADPDQLNQYTAMMGIAETVGEVREWSPSYPLFEQGPERYLDHWRLWWESEGKAQYGTSAP